MQLGVREVSKLLNVSEKTIYRWVGQGILPAYRVNEQYRFNRAELLEWATSRKMNVSAAVFDEPESNSTPIPGLVEALQAGGIFYRLSGAAKEGALRAVVEHMRLPEEVDREFLLRVLLAREALQSGRRRRHRHSPRAQPDRPPCVSADDYALLPGATDR